MKFGKLLAAGKSWVGGNGIGRYQMRDGMALPKFISPKNPFKQEAVAQPVAPSPVVAAPATVSVDMPVSVPTNVVVNSPVVGVVEKAGAMKLRQPLSVKLRAMAEWAGELLKRAALFCLDHNPFSAIGKPRLPQMPRFGKSVVQGELSLDRVKVVRNDLSHADLEVVRLGVGPK